MSEFTPDAFGSNVDMRGSCDSRNGGLSGGCRGCPRCAHSDTYTNVSDTSPSGPHFLPVQPEVINMETTALGDVGDPDSSAGHSRALYEWSAPGPSGLQGSTCSGDEETTRESSCSISSPYSEDGDQCGEDSDLSQWEVEGAQDSSVQTRNEGFKREQGVEDKGKLPLATASKRQCGGKVCEKVSTHIVGNAQPVPGCEYSPRTAVFHLRGDGSNGEPRDETNDGPPSKRARYISDAEDASPRSLTSYTHPADNSFRFRAVQAQSTEDTARGEQCTRFHEQETEPQLGCRDLQVSNPASGFVRVPGTCHREPTVSTEKLANNYVMIQESQIWQMRKQMEMMHMQEKRQMVEDFNRQLENIRQENRRVLKEEKAKRSARHTKVKRNGNRKVPGKEDEEGQEEIGEDEEGHPADNASQDEIVTHVPSMSESVKRAKQLQKAAFRKQAEERRYGYSEEARALHSASLSRGPPRLIRTVPNVPDNTAPWSSAALSAPPPYEHHHHLTAPPPHLLGPPLQSVGGMHTVPPFIQGPWHPPHGLVPSLYAGWHPLQGPFPHGGWYRAQGPFPNPHFSAHQAAAAHSTGLPGPYGQSTGLPPPAGSYAVPPQRSDPYTRSDLVRGSYQCGPTHTTPAQGTELIADVGIALGTQIRSGQTVYQT